MESLDQHMPRDNFSFFVGKQLTILRISNEKGIHQGHPLSPVLFLIVAEGINVAIQEALDIGVLKGLYILYICIFIVSLCIVIISFRYNKTSKKNGTSVTLIFHNLSILSFKPKVGTYVMCMLWRSHLLITGPVKLLKKNQDLAL